MQLDLYQKRLTTKELLLIRRKELYKEMKRQVTKHQQSIIGIIKNYLEEVKKIDTQLQKIR